MLKFTSTLQLYAYFLADTITRGPVNILIKSWRYHCSPWNVKEKYPATLVKDDKADCIKDPRARYKDHCNWDFTIR